MKPPVLALLTASVLSVSPTVYALQIAYEDFSYTAGETINGKNGGTGWTSAWTTQPGGEATTASVPLTYSGGSINVTGDTSTALVGADSTALYDRTFAPQTGTLYFSFLFRYDDNGGAGNLDTNDFVHFMLNNDSNNTNSGGIELLSTSTSFLGARIGGSNGGTTTSSTTTMMPDTTYFLVGKIWKDGSTEYNTVDLFVNPTSPVESENTISQTDTASMSESEISHFTLRGANIDLDDRYIFDELRIGTTFDSVAPIPEPSSALLITGGTGLLLASRRKRQP